MTLFILMAQVPLLGTSCNPDDIVKSGPIMGNCKYEAETGCFSSSGFNVSRYAGDEDCSVETCKEVTYTINGFSIEASGSSCMADALTVDQTKYCGYGDTPSEKDDTWTGTPQGVANVPNSWSGTLGPGKKVSFKSDDSDHYHGFQICFQGKEQEVVTPSPPQAPASDDNGLGAEEIAGIAVGGVVFIGLVFFLTRRRYMNKNKQITSSIGKLMF